MAITPEQTQYYDNLAEMMGTQGWRSLLEEAKSEIYQLQADALEAPNIETVCILRGKAQQLAYLINLQGISTNQRAILEEPDPEVDEEEAE